MKPISHQTQNRMLVLLVEDNTAVAKIVSAKLKSELGIEVHLAKSYAEAVYRMQSNQYDLALLDLNLPDAPNGEIIEFTLAQKVKTIVLSGMIDKEFRKKMIDKEIVDYIKKGQIEDISTVVETIDQLRKNSFVKVLVVDDSFVYRKQISKMLEIISFNVLSTEDPLEALEYIKSDETIKIMITDYEMPKMNGIELIRAVRKIRHSSELGIIGVSANNDDEISALFLKNGATDFIKKPFSKEEFNCRINNTAKMIDNYEAIMTYASKDYMTGLYNRRYFYDKAPKIYEQCKKSMLPFALCMIDIDHFKSINDTYGHDIGDLAIIKLSETLISCTRDDDLVARVGGEEFCILFKNIDKEDAYAIVERIRSNIQNQSLETHKGIIQFTVSVGLQCELDISIDRMLIKADHKLYESKNNGRNQITL